MYLGSCTHNSGYIIILYIIYIQLATIVDLTAIEDVCLQGGLSRVEEDQWL